MWIEPSNLAVSWALLALIWIVQLVHYPSFHYVEADLFPAFQAHHTRSITYVVMPLMLAELALAAWWAWQTGGAWTTLVPLWLVLLVWVSTFLVQVPLHNQLTHGKDATVIDQLVRTNWWRTICWTLKAAWVSAIVISERMM